MTWWSMQTYALRQARGLMHMLAARMSEYSRTDQASGCVRA